MMQRAKRDHLNALRESAELHDPHLTFQPRICRWAASQQTVDPKLLKADRCRGRG